MVEKRIDTNKNTSSYKKVISFQVSLELDKQLQTRANKSGISKSDVMRMLLEQGLRNEQ